MAAVRTIEEIEARQSEIKGRLQEIDVEFAGEALPDETRSEWNGLNEEQETNGKLLDELRTRKARLEDLSKAPDAREAGATFATGSRKSERDIYDLSEIRALAFASPDEAKQTLRDNAMRAVEIERSFPHEQANKEDVQGAVARLLDSVDDERGSIARRILITGSPAYRRAFGKYLAQQPLGNEELRALSLTAGEGGYAVPFVLDPTVIPVSNLAVNPFRGISRVEQITVDEWRGVTSTGITAAYAAELTEAGDDAPALLQPTVSTEKAQAFIPFSIEIGMDWSGLQSEMARLLQDAKDELEATKFATGTGTNEPFGVITGATTTVSPVTGGAFVVADLYALEAALPPRFRPRASMVMNRAIAQKIRQFDTAGGAQLWIDNLRVGLDNQVPTPGNYGARVLGYGAYESSAMASTVTTGSKAIIIGDFNHFLIADRVGLSVELIPHLFALANNRPSGQRGLYAYWRNGSKVLAANAFRVLQL